MGDGRFGAQDVAGGCLRRSPFFLLKKFPSYQIASVDFVSPFGDKSPGKKNPGFESFARVSSSWAKFEQNCVAHLV